jgi:hypothetical protein
MIEVKQNTLHDPDNGQHGDCLSAVLASLLHLPIESIPVFSNEDTWVKELNTWLYPFGLAYFLLDNLAEALEVYGIHGLWHDVSGNTTRSTDVEHACVAHDGVMMFDPHPDETGLTKVTSYGIFVVLEPWKVVALRNTGLT